MDLKLFSSAKKKLAAHSDADNDDDLNSPRLMDKGGARSHKKSIPLMLASQDTRMSQQLNLGPLRVAPSAGNLHSRRYLDYK